MSYRVKLNPTDLERRFSGWEVDYLRDGDGQIAEFADFAEAVRVINWLNQIPVRRTWGYIVEGVIADVSGRGLQERDVRLSRCRPSRGAARPVPRDAPG